MRRLFICVHLGVRGLEWRHQGFLSIKGRGAAHGDIDVKGLVACILKRCPQVEQEALCVLFIRIASYDQKLVSAHAGRHGTGRKDTLDGACDPANQLVTHSMPIGVVGFLKTVAVQHDQGLRGTCRRNSGLWRMP